MTIREIIQKYEKQVADVEVYVAEGNIDRLHTDRIEAVDNLDKDFDYRFPEDIAYEEMDEETYDQTIMANGSGADFEEWYDDEEATVLVIAIRKGSEVYEQTPADRIKALRKMTGLSQTAFGKKYGIPMRTIQNWENGANEAPEYVVGMLEQIVWEQDRDERMQWYGVDDCGTDYYTEAYASRTEAIERAGDAWNNLTEHDRKQREAFWVGLLDECGDAVIVARKWK